MSSPPKAKKRKVETHDNIEEEGRDNNINMDVDNISLNAENVIQNDELNRNGVNDNRREGNESRENEMMEQEADDLGLDDNRIVENDESDESENASSDREAISSSVGEDEREEYEEDDDYSEDERIGYETDESATDELSSNEDEVSECREDEGEGASDELSENERIVHENIEDEAVEHRAVENEAVERRAVQGEAVERRGAEGEVIDRVEDGHEVIERAVNRRQGIERVADEGEAAERRVAEGEAIEGDVIEGIAGDGEAFEGRANAVNEIEHFVGDGAINEAGVQNNREAELMTDEEAELNNNGPFRALFQGIAENAGLNLPLEYKQDITSMDHLLFTLAMGLRYGHCYEDIIKQLSWTKDMFVDSNIPTTMAQLWKLLGRNKENMVCRLYCLMCRDKVGKGSTPTHNCTCGRCGPGKAETYLSTFIQIRLGPQLSELLNLPNISEALRYKVNRTKVNPDGIEDIYDGEEYKRLEQPGQFLSDQNNFSLTLWTDGVELAKSSKASAYPILLQVNELHPYARKKHLIMAGIWVGRGSPGVLTEIMLPVVRDIKIINTHGVTRRLEGGGEVISRFIAIIFTGDSVAKPNVCRMKQFNGEFGCVTCLAPGEQIARNVRVYRAQAFDLRTDMGIRSDAIIALRTGIPQNGVKGCSALSALPREFNLVHGVVADSCHMAYEGVAKQFLKLILTSTNEPYYIGHPDNLNTIDRQLLSIKTPTKISRTARSITEYNTWKASEFRNWVLYYSVPCLHGVLPPTYLSLWKKFVLAMFILNKYSIEAAELNQAEILVTEFIRGFQTLFGLRNMSFNVHLLSHAVYFVRKWGPLWAFSTFPFESFNRTIVESVTSPNSRAQQIVTRFLMRKFIVTAIREVVICERTEEEIEELLCATRVIVPAGMTEGDYFVGKGKVEVRPPTAEELQLIRRAGFQVAEETELTLYKKAVIHGVRYMVIDDVERKTCDSIVYSVSGFWKITSFLRYTIGEDTICGFFGEKMVDRGNLFGLNYMRKVVDTRQKAFVPYQTVIVPGISIQLEGGNTCAIPLCNSMEMD